jgi:predicted metal-dependent hydrolase
MDVVISGEIVALEVVQSKGRRTISLSFLSRQAAELRVPKIYPEHKLLEFLQKHRKWMERAYKNYLARKPVFREGRVLFHGKYYKVVHIDAQDLSIELFSESIVVHSRDILLLKEALCSWLEQHTREYIESKKQVFSRFRVNKVTVKPSKQRWGWATPKGEVFFNSLLAALPLELMEYVVCHELSHLFEMNHSSRFKARLYDMLPDYRAREKALSKFMIG